MRNTPQSSWANGPLSGGGHAPAVETLPGSSASATGPCTARKHHFDDGTVVTVLLPTGEYGTYRHDEDEVVCGRGHSRFAAIADLVEQLGADDDEDIDHQAAAFDHARDLRKHEAGA